MRIVFSAVLSVPPFTPGSALHRLHNVLGLIDLGHDVYFVEETYRDACVDEAGAVCPFESSVNFRTFVTTTTKYGLAGRSCLLYERGAETAGMTLDQIVSVARTADLLINVSGHLSTGPVFDGPGCRAYVDHDPVYTQLWHAEYGEDLGFADHDVFVTRGLNIGTARSPIPDCSIDWIPVLPTVMLSESWAPPDSDGTSYSTVASWGVFGDVSYRGEWYGSRREELIRFARLPALVDVPLEMMVKAYEREDDEVRALLETSGWRLADASSIGDIEAYVAYIDRSRGEVGVAKNAYVKARSGWFSERSAEYLAAGRPVIAQSTGFESSLPTGAGLLSFSTLDEAVDAVQCVEKDLTAHARAARELAETYLSHRRVLPQLLDAVGEKIR